MTIYLIRHGQSEFNAAFAVQRPNDPMIFDAPLTELGRQQAIEAGKKMAELGVEHVIASPMTRAIQTAMHIFGDDHPITVDPRVREKLDHSCDVGSHPSILERLFEHLSFDHLAPHWWHGDPDHDDRIQPEPEDVFVKRAREFREWLDAWDQGPVAVVGHGTFFTQLAGHHMQNCEIHQYRS